jgi:hypothetical protein
MITRLWSRYGWQTCTAVLLSMLSLLSFLEIPALDWLGYFGTVGELVSVAVLRAGGFTALAPAIALGFLLNVLFIAGLLVAATRLIARVAPRTGSNVA